MRSWAVTTIALTGALIASAATPGSGSAEPASKVFLNGVPSPVYFNDGDSFRVLAGQFSGSKARLSGYNTLESYGPVHGWGAKSLRELYVNAKQGTLNARRGPCWDDARGGGGLKPGCNAAWHCTSDLKRDGYGRILWWCPDLAYDQVRKGLAHVMSVDGPGEPKLIEAQRLAISERLNMWARGVPEFVLTSTHSFSEPYAQEMGSAYNRLVSVADGHSQKWLHKREYGECEAVCRMAVVDVEAIVSAAEVVKRDPTIVKGALTMGELVAGYDAEALIKIVRRFAETGEVYLAAPEHVEALAKVLGPMRKAGKLGELRMDSCMIYTSFNRRYGSNAAPCMH